MPFPRKYNTLLTTAKAITFSLYEIDGIDLRVDAVFATGDVTISKDGGAEANVANLPVDNGKGYSLVLTAAELSASQVRISIVDLTATKAWLDIELVVETYGNASAMHQFDLGTASTPQTADHTAGIADIPTVSEFNARTVLSATYSTAVNLATVDGIVDTLLARIIGTLASGTHNPATVAQLATLTDWIDGGRLDLLVDAIKVVTDAQTAITPEELIDLAWDEPLSGHNVGGSAGKKLKSIPDTLIREETAQGSGTGNNQIQLDVGASATDNAYDPSLIFINSGTGVGQSRNIIQYNGTSKTATVDRNWKVNPDATSTYSILADAGREHVNEGLAQGGTANTITLNALASSQDDVYEGQIVFIRSGTGDDQSGTITAYNGTSKVATVHRNWKVIPDSTSGYVMLPASPVALTANTITAITADIDTNSTKLTSIVADTNELQLNQGDWLTATGFNTTTPLSAAGIRTAVGLATANMDTQFAASVTASGFATPTNITAASGIVLSGVTHTGAVIPTVSTLTNKSGFSISGTINTLDDLNNAPAVSAATISTSVWSETTRTLTAFSFQVNCDVKQINGATVLGIGISGNLWRG